MGIEDSKNKISRRHFLGLAAVATGAVTAFHLLKKHSERKLAEREKENDSKKKEATVEGTIREINQSLGAIENYIKEFKEQVPQIEKGLSDIETATSKSSQNADEINAYEEILTDVINTKQSLDDGFLYSQDQFAELVRYTDALLNDQRKLGMPDSLQKWENEEYLPRKARIEEQMKLLGEQYQEIDTKFDILITKIGEEIRKAKEKLGIEKRNVNLV